MTDDADDADDADAADAAGADDGAEGAADRAAGAGGTDAEERDGAGERDGAAPTGGRGSGGGGDESGGGGGGDGDGDGDGVPGSATTRPTVHPDLDVDTVHTGDAFEVLRELPAESVHAVVCDPPYGLDFMDLDWDGFGGGDRGGAGSGGGGDRRPPGAADSDAPGDMLAYQVWCRDWARLAMRVLRPGGHLVAFSGPATHHRLFCGVEDAGFEVRDTLLWVYGNGMPKALDVGREVDRQVGTDRRALAARLREAREAAGLSRAALAERVGCSEASVRDWEEGRRRSPDGPVEWVLPERDRRERLAEVLDGYPAPKEVERVDAGRDRRGDGTVIDLGHSGERTVYPDPSAAAERWDGFKTTLKPAADPAVLARKPLAAGTVAENVLEYGTGALNVDAGRIPPGGRPGPLDRAVTGRAGGVAGPGGDGVGDAAGASDATGRAGGDSGGGGDGGGGDAPEDDRIPAGRYPTPVFLDPAAAADMDAHVGETGGGEGVVREEQTGAGSGPVYGEFDDHHVFEYDDRGGPSRYFYVTKVSRSERTLDGRIDNDHPTVKPRDLMRQIVRLVTAEGQVVCDPFAGTGTTLWAAKDIGRRFVGVERDPEWADVARARAGLTPDDPDNVIADDDQASLSSFVD